MAHKQRSTNGQTPSDNPSLPKMPTTSLDEQQAHRFLSEKWQPNGFHRYRYAQALLDEMAVLGGFDDNGGANPDRYRPLDGSGTSGV